MDNRLQWERPVLRITAIAETLKGTVGGDGVSSFQHS